MKYKFINRVYNMETQDYHSGWFYFLSEVTLISVYKCMCHVYTFTRCPLNKINSKIKYVQW